MPLMLSGQHGDGVVNGDECFDFGWRLWRIEPVHSRFCAARRHAVELITVSFIAAVVLVIGNVCCG